MKRLTDSTFQYTPSVETDIRKTFARVRRELREAEKRQAANQAEATAKVLPMAQGKK